MGVRLLVYHKLLPGLATAVSEFCFSRCQPGPEKESSFGRCLVMNCAPKPIQTLVKVRVTHIFDTLPVSIDCVHSEPQRSPIKHSFVYPLKTDLQYSLTIPFLSTPPSSSTASAYTFPLLNSCFCLLNLLKVCFYILRRSLARQQHSRKKNYRISGRGLHKRVTVRSGAQNNP